MTKNEYIIAFDVGGTRVKAGIFKNDTLLESNILEAPSKQVRHHILDVFKVAINRLIDTYSIGNNLTGIAFAMPALVDVRRIMVLSTNEKYQSLEGFDMAQWVFENWKVPCFMDNDARMALVGEWQYGAALSVDNVVMMTLGTGIGTAAIIEGKVLRGKHYQAGCLGGHFTIDFQGEKCNCGNKGCLESTAASWNLEGRIQSHSRYRSSLLKKEKNLDFYALFKAARKGDVLAVEERERCLKVWGAGVVNLIHAYDPEMVVLGGGIMKSKEEIVPSITETVRKHAWTPWGDITVVSSALEDVAALYGLNYGLQQKNGPL